MNPMVNMIIVLEKELEMERQGLRRTRRYIGDASQVADPRWYQRDINRAAESKLNLGEVRQVEDSEPCREPFRSRLARLFHLPRLYREPRCNEC